MEFLLFDSDSQFDPCDTWVIVSPHVDERPSLTEQHEIQHTLEDLPEFGTRVFQLPIRFSTAFFRLLGIPATHGFLVIPVTA
jgi:hypothetical protein